MPYISHRKSSGSPGEFWGQPAIIALAVSMFLTGFFPFGLYMASYSFYTNAVQTTCTIKNVEFIADICGKSKRECYNVNVLYAYNVKPRKQETFENSFTTQNRDSSTVKNVKRDYKIGKKVTCYYDSKNPKDAALKYDYTYLISFSVLFGTSALLMVCLAIYKIINCKKLVVHNDLENELA